MINKLEMPRRPKNGNLSDGDYIRLESFTNDLIKGYNDMVDKVKNNVDLAVVSGSLMTMNEAATLIDSMPTDQAIQIIKARLTDKPVSTKIECDLIIQVINYR